MRAELEILKADIKDELSKLQKVYDQFITMKEKVGLDEDRISENDKIVIGYLLHNFYSGCENIFRSISRFFENGPDNSPVFPRY